MVANNEFPISYRLSGILALEYAESGGDELELDEVNLFFNEVNQIITLKPLPDTDEVEIVHQTSLPIGLVNTPTWGKSFMGQTLQAVWVCQNQQGYQDMVIFAFDLLHPSLTFLAEGSVLKLLRHEVVKRAYIHF